MGGLFDLESKKKKLQELENKMNEEGFWDDTTKATDITTKVNNLKKEILKTSDVSAKIKSLDELLTLLETEEDKDLEKEIIKSLEEIEMELNDLEISVLLSGKYDDLNCYLEIHPGAGGTESCDWADMLLRMYTKFCEKNNYNYEIIESQKGEEAGLKSVTVLIKGEYAYGYFKGESGVHRLVRISPFDSGARRHTSFASVTITPEFSKDVEVEINEKDLKIDVYRSSGKGGQGVNTTDSAVRITHLPTKTVVTCQNERSQIKNKEIAMNILKSKLYQIELNRQEAKLNEIKGVSTNIDFGSQIRSYVLEPYTMVKDSRTGFETSQADKVLDGDILDFMVAMLKRK